MSMPETGVIDLSGVESQFLEPGLNRELYPACRVTGKKISLHVSMS